MLKINTSKRLWATYTTIGKTFGQWFSPLFTGLFIPGFKLKVILYNYLDKLFLPKVATRRLKTPILIVGNPRSGTTFLQRFLATHVGTGSELWELIFSSLILQKFVKPFLPLLEKFSPTKHHSTEAHKTSLSSVETDDASILFRYNDGFFLYGFILAWAEEDLFPWFDPQQRNMAERDFDWLSRMWSKKLYKSKKDYYFGKLFSVSANMPSFQRYFPDGKVLYMVRDPLQVIPSGLSLITGVLDKKFGFWNLPKEKRERYLNRMYLALKELLIRFHADWTTNKIDKTKVKIVTFNRLMNDFDNLMFEILEFLEIEKSTELNELILETAKTQNEFQSNHQYNLEKFGLNEAQIKIDCKEIYDTFLNGKF